MYSHQSFIFIFINLYLRTSGIPIAGGIPDCIDKQFFLIAFEIEI